MLTQLKNFLSRSPPPTTAETGPPCKYSHCAQLTYCLKTIGEETLSEVHSLTSLISDHFDPAHESDYAWDSDYGWTEFCHRCRQERCQECGTGVFTSVTGFQDVLTFENREVWICCPYKHGKCPGWKLRVLSLCEVFGHGACGECMPGGDEKMGVVCCQCALKDRTLEDDVEGENKMEDVKPR
jgi:hypothetical protein